MKRDTIIYWIATGLLSIMMLASAARYILQYNQAVEQWSNYGFPAYAIYFLATCKLLGVVAIVTRKSPTLKEWAYAGFFFNFCLALLAQLNIGGQPQLPLIAMALLFTSYFFERKLK